MPKKKTLSPAAALAAELNNTLGVNVRMGSDPYFIVQRVPTGSLVIDRITGGGFARGRHVEIYGDASAGKSTLVYSTMALAQQRDEICAMVDPERVFDPDWFSHLGGDPDELLLFQPDNGEDAIAVMMTIARHAQEGDLGIVGIDSVASLIPSEEAAKDPREGDDRVAGRARMMSRALRRITSVNQKTLFLWTNQEISNVGVRFGSPKTTPGGRALRFYATTRIEMRLGKKVTAKRRRTSEHKIVERDVAIGRWIQCRAEKEKTAKPLGEGSFIFNNERGEIDVASEIITLGLEDDLIDRVGNNFIYEDLEGYTWKGMEKKFYKLIHENEELRDELISAIQANTLELAKVGADDDESESDDDENDE